MRRCLSGVARTIIAQGFWSPGHDRFDFRHADPQRKVRGEAGTGDSAVRSIANQRGSWEGRVTRQG